MPTLGPLPTRPPVPAEEEGLDALLDLLAGTDAPAAPSLRTSIARLLAWVQGSSRRAATWGAAPEHAGGTW